jgi:prevent-host-death family protein
MRTVQASEAKAHFAALLDAVERGEEIVIARHGKSIARLVPDQNDSHGRTERAISDIDRLRRTLPALSLDEWISARQEGRRF